MALSDETAEDKIMKARTASPALAGQTLQSRQRLSQERILATLRLRIKTLEDLNRGLREQLEAAYGQLQTADEPHHFGGGCFLVL